MSEMHTVKFIVRFPADDDERVEEFRVEGFQGAYSVGCLLERVPEVSYWCCEDADGAFKASWDRSRQ